MLNPVNFHRDSWLTRSPVYDIGKSFRGIPFFLFCNKVVNVCFHQCSLLWLRDTWFSCSLASGSHRRGGGYFGRWQCGVVGACMEALSVLSPVDNQTEGRMDWTSCISRHHHFFGEWCWETSPRIASFGYSLLYPTHQSNMPLRRGRFKRPGDTVFPFLLRFKGTAS